MFYFDDFYGKKVLKSDFIKDTTAFFTTREGINEINLNAKRIIKPDQTHSINIDIVNERNEYGNTDSLILTNNKDALMLRFADCVPLILYDSRNHIGAIAHAGWRGTAGKIGIKTAEKMYAEFGSKPEDMTVLVGPAISLCCYEVGEDVKEKLLSTVKNKSGLYNKSNVDLKKINARQFEEAGLSKIDICPYCTVCNNDLFYSYRKENGTANRHFAVIKLS